MDIDGRVHDGHQVSAHGHNAVLKIKDEENVYELNETILYEVNGIILYESDDFERGYIIPAYENYSLT